ncbi:large proline-rich protein bag6-A isoform X5 [Phlebotomus papatasi]|uniref:large proline-rich protein bag6-A isoform X5 n=1 Tax=Phlebotomus papatasi TaxID=29031 RepID=UPI002483798B|nr:large proline-rich protein bag6-A isoform X5 [Phlebotomus papatasi]
MINVTVKTLDSQNHQFAVDDEITVRQFKEHIAEKVSVEADLQRIIYCGRLLKDEKLLKEYDVNGKVVHLVQRAPPSTRTPTSTTESAPQNRWRVRNLNPRSPLIRAIDGMVLGAMAIPMNTNNGTPQAAAPSLNPSSTLCMNRITVARHMLECANNIARFLENPEGQSSVPQGLNNTAMEDLAQQTLESTVFEVGISAVGEVDIPQVQMQNLVQAFQGAVSAALRQNGVPNIRLLQQQMAQAEGAEGMPTVQILEATPVEDIASMSTAPTAPPAPAEAPAGATGGSGQEGSTSQSQSNTENTSEAGSTPGSRSRQQTTRTQTLATVVQQMRDVQVRLEPFVQQYYDILQNDPTYETDEERNNAQRVFDHVSEAFHYISHAQHAISDLMLCLSSNTPRHLCCRPILVEQSAFVSSGFTVPANLATVTRPNGNNNETAAAAAAAAAPQNENNNTANGQQAPTVEGGQQQQQQQQQQASNETTPRQGLPTAPQSADQSDENRLPRGIPRNIFSLFLPISNRTAIRTDNGVPVNQELQIARIIQAVVNTAPMDAEVQVEINPPQSSASNNQQSTVTNTSSNSTATIAPNELTINVHLGDIGALGVIGGGPNQPPRVTTVTLPTTSTQTRSTARQQMHSGNLPTAQMRNFRPTSSNIFSAFDRFLPCNSHHIRDPNQQTGGEPRVRVSAQPQSAPQSRTGQNQVPTAEAGNSSQGQGPQIAGFPIFGNSLDVFQVLHIGPQLINDIRSQLQGIVRDIFFNGSAVSEESTAQAVDVFMGHAEQVLALMPRIEDSDYDVRASVENLLRATIPRAFDVVMSENPTDFGRRVLAMFHNFSQRLCRILLFCIGREGSERYLSQVTRMYIDNQAPADNLRPFHRHLMNEIERILDSVGNVNQEEIQSFLVIRARAPPAATVVPEVTAQRPEQPPEEPMETDEFVLEEPSQSQSQNTNVDDDPLEGPIEPQPWHRQFPTDWIPIITKDVQKQRRPQSSQLPFSDAYLAGMSSKRRKMIACSKASTDVQEVVSEGVRQAIKATGLSCASQTPVDDISRAIATDSSVQASYHDQMKEWMPHQYMDHPDYSPDRFPNISKYFNPMK